MYNNSYSGEGDSAKPYRWESTSSAEPFRKWHRTYGRQLYATDLDFVEYTFSDTGAPLICGFFEYKHVNGRTIAAGDTQLQIVTQIAGAAEVPSFFVRYTTTTPITYLLYPLDTRAAISTEYKNLILSEQQFARFLYFLRDLSAPSSVYQLPNERQNINAFPVDNPPFVRVALSGAWAYTEATTASYA